MARPKTPSTMHAVLLTGHGGLDKLEYQSDVPVPKPAAGEVLIKVTATGKNNTDRKVREGLYGTESDDQVASFQLGGVPTLTFPRIQGADTVGRIASVGAGVDKGRIGERCLVDFNIYPPNADDINLQPDYYGHGKDGGFAEYMVAPSDQAHVVDNPELSDPELAALGMCSYQTALHMLNEADVTEGERVLITGASGGVGTALIQLCRIRGAIPYAVTSAGKSAQLLELGAEATLERERVRDWVTEVDRMVGGKVVDAVMDLVGGALMHPLMRILGLRSAERRSYPRYSIAGASGGNPCEILASAVYLYQIHLYGVSHGTRREALQLIECIRDGSLKPVLHKIFPLSRIADAERYFMERSSDFVGKIVIVPDSELEE